MHAFADGELRIDVHVQGDVLVMCWRGAARAHCPERLSGFVESVADLATRTRLPVSMRLPPLDHLDRPMVTAVLRTLRRLREQNTRTFTSFASRSVPVRSIPNRKKAPMVHLEITLQIPVANRPAAVGVYTRYRAPFLAEVVGARSKQLLVRDEDVQVLHAFDTADHASAYLKSALFSADIVSALAPLLSAPPDVRIYQVAG